MPIINPPVPSDGNTAVAADVDDPVNQIVALLNGGLDTDNFADGGIQLADLSSAIQALLMPTGALTPFAGSSAPTGWLFCDGASLLRSSYSALFAAIGTNFGSADGTHFNLPDLRGRTPVGRETMNGTSTTGRIEKSTTISTTNASPTATVASSTDLVIGMFITSTNVPAGTKITAIIGTTVTMSANATATASGTAARFSMLGNDAEVLGAAGGEQSHLLAATEIPNLNLDVQRTGGGATTALSANGSGNSAWSTELARYSGGGMSHADVQPSLIVNYLIKT